jgi:hypothetical protein
MFAKDLRVLCAALGFTAVAIKGGLLKKDRAARAEAFARTIEEFCQRYAKDGGQPKGAAPDAAIEELKANLQAKQSADLPEDYDLLHRLYLRLQERHTAYATHDLIADEALHLLDEEIQHEAGGAMRIVDLCEHPNAEPAFSRHEDMATAVVEILRVRGECSPKDLEAKGFAPDDIKRHWAMAYALAKVELNWMDS